ncbi:MAG: ATP-binding cassette domain-containing protein, partial [Pseudomonadota bacterium]
DCLKFWSDFMQPNHDINLQKIISTFDLMDFIDQDCANLSTGQARRVCLSRLLIEPRPIWLLDEPLNGLDEKTRKLLKKIQKQHRNQGGMIIFASHQNPDWHHLTHLDMTRFAC